MFVYSYWFLSENICFGGKWHATGSHMTCDVIKTPKVYKYQGGLFIFQKLDLIVVETLCCFILHRYFNFESGVNITNNQKSQVNPVVMKTIGLAERYHNPNPLYRLIGPTNESQIFIEGRSCLGLIDRGAQLLAISLKLVQELGLKIFQLKSLLEIEGLEGIDVPYLGYVEARLRIPGIPGFDEDSLFLVVPNSNYTEQVPVSIGTLHID